MFAHSFIHLFVICLFICLSTRTSPVPDDEDSKTITVGSLVNVAVHLFREGLLVSHTSQYVTQCTVHSHMYTIVHYSVLYVVVVAMAIYCIHSSGCHGNVPYVVGPSQSVSGLSAGEDRRQRQSLTGGGGAREGGGGGGEGAEGEHSGWG